MPPARHTLTLLPAPLAICRLPADAPAPAWAHAPPFSSVTRTPDELSVVCAASAVPRPLPDGARLSDGWRALRVDGPLDLALVGVLAPLAAALAEAAVSVFPVATFDTDWLLVREAQVERARDALTAAGHVVRAG
jgi:hypothetical protein